MSYLFECICNLESLTFRADRKKKFKSVVITDSIFQNFPVATLHINDESGEIHDSMYFIEDLDFYMQFGSEDAGFISHNFTWTEDQLTSGTAGESTGGLHYFIMLSDFYKQDSVKTRAYKGEPSTIVENIIKNYKFPGKTAKYIGESEKFRHINISKTKSDDIWYQSNDTDFGFIDQLTTYSLPRNQTGGQNSPYLSFVNMRGDFYFMDLWSMFQQPVSKELALSDDPDRNMNSDIIQNYQMEFLGSPDNSKNYNRNVYRIDSKGEFISDKITLEDYFMKYDREKKAAPYRIPIQKDSITNLRNVTMMGIEEDDTDRKAYQAQLNSYYLNTLTSYRMRAFVKYDAELATGKVINMTVKSKLDNKLFNWEYVGKWLIIETKFMYNIADPKSEPALSLLLARPSVNIFQKHPLVNEFIGA